MNRSFENIITLASESSLPYLLIGGNCVNLYGYARTTFDLDLLINRDDKREWLSYWQKHSYQEIWTEGAFTRLRSDEDFGYPIDLMTVEEGTFLKFQEQQTHHRYNDQLIPSPSPIHLIALKLHALKNANRDEEKKDLLDIYGLIEACQIDTKSSEFINTLDKYASNATIEKIHGRFP